ncbi:uncharacterized protein LOC128891867 [Hylaeus anthracinus]|uniref:uncharacterized protein LOC128891867 n=1 Tax=Hylaeus anthracinus TaxID=313031 RepID=UPI0023B96505|nr:uncharacterized protein LOC128891867 [Hylaeus anthracinus]
MEEFRRQYSTLYFLMCITGLWPFDKSILVKVQRTIIAIVIFCCIVIQFSSLIMTELTLTNILMTLTLGCPLLLFFFRYVGFIYSFSVMGYVYENINNDCSTLKNPSELDILSSHIDDSRRAVLIYLRKTINNHINLGVSKSIVVTCCFAIFLIGVVLFCPWMLNFLIAKNQTQPHYLKALGFFIEDRYVTPISVYIIVTFIIGLFTITVTEATLAVFAYYACGLFKITSYRIQKMIDNAAREMSATKCNVSYHSSIREAVDIHGRVINIIDSVANGVTLAYLIAIILVVVSFGLNMYRFFIAVVDVKDPLEIALGTMIVSVHLAIMFLNNHSGQKIRDDSLSVFDDTYDTVWYRTPVDMQKMLLIIMVRSSIMCECNLSGLFVPCYEGFSMMMSTSFSYFTLLYSVQ